jgi:hypothetical protein
VTTNQIVAIFWPALGIGAAVAAGLFSKWIWVDRPRAEAARRATLSGRRGDISEGESPAQLLRVLGQTAIAAADEIEKYESSKTP